MAEGLRERKRRETRVSIQRAALELAVETGDMHPTVEAIAARAFVSQRTFFNYFPSRDAALVGDPLELPDDVDPAAGSDLFGMLTDVVLRTVAAEEVDRDLVILRREVMKQAPDLFGMRIALGHEFDRKLVDIAVQRCELDGVDLPEQRGRVAALVVMAAARAGWFLWTDGGESTLCDAMTTTFRQLRELAAETIDSRRG